jgi:hypothetical protein
MLFQNPPYMASRQLMIPWIAAVGTSFSLLPCQAWHGYGVTGAHRVEVEVGAEGPVNAPPPGPPPLRRRRARLFEQIEEEMRRLGLQMTDDKRAISVDVETALRDRFRLLSSHGLINHATIKLRVQLIVDAACISPTAYDNGHVGHGIIWPCNHARQPFLNQ